jgi:hypothetical protein
MEPQRVVLFAGDPVVELAAIPVVAGDAARRQVYRRTVKPMCDIDDVP